METAKTAVYLRIQSLGKLKQKPAVYFQNLICWETDTKTYSYFEQRNSDINMETIQVETAKNLQFIQNLISENWYQIPHFSTLRKCQTHHKQLFYTDIPSFKLTWNIIQM